ncbi:hypothetical protein CH367_19170 [Leptospira barantonii]|uniref:Uncharacterized protein n=1 Tax=Leptospira barantonii TaxID=2023184 RepID=A0ABX4NFR7_9LEPT|nr:hypothetical protein CH367_19170 [Leptospira barantonii]
MDELRNEANFTNDSYRNGLYTKTYSFETFSLIKYVKNLFPKRENEARIRRSISIDNEGI